MSSVLILPPYSEGMGAILKENSIVLLAGLGDGIHICYLTTHVGNENMFAVGVGGELFLQGLNIHNVIVIRLYVNSLSSGVLNGTWNSSKGKRVTDDLATVFESASLEEKHEGRTTRVESNTVLVSGIFCKLDLALGDSRFLSSLYVVTVHLSSLHELKSSLLSLKGDRIGGLDISGDDSSCSNFGNSAESISAQGGDKNKCGGSEFDHCK
mmetsp:Transcript_8166/g.12032  ORF Transcript_8166/g.12032 Transcript_8166/m.12032 type:complete len:211 (+) Transcript_8166:1070-1702(+)